MYIVLLSGDKFASPSTRARAWARASAAPRRTGDSFSRTGARTRLQSRSARRTSECVFTLILSVGPFLPSTYPFVRAIRDENASLRAKRLKSEINVWNELRDRQQDVPQNNAENYRFKKKKDINARFRRSGSLERTIRYCRSFVSCTCAAKQIETDGQCFLRLVEKQVFSQVWFASFPRT